LNQGAGRNPTTGRTPVKWVVSQASEFYSKLNVTMGHPALDPRDSLVPGGIDDFAFYNATPPSGLRALGYTLELPPMSADGHTAFELPDADIRPVFRMCLGATLAFITLCAERNPTASQFGVFGLVP
jgi:hypothetical protein